MPPRRLAFTFALVTTLASMACDREPAPPPPASPVVAEAWRQEVNDPIASLRARALVEIDGDYVAVAQISDPSRPQPAVALATVADGELDTRHRLDSDVRREVADAAEGPERGILLVGRERSSDSPRWHGWASLVDNSGHPSWSVRLGARTRVMAAAWTGDSWWLVGEQTTDDGDTEGWIATLSETGELLHASTVGGPGPDVLHDVTWTGEDAVASGSKTVEGRGADGWVVRLSADGSPSKETTVGGGGSDAFFGLAATTDGLVAVGQRRTEESGLDLQPWWVELDAELAVDTDTLLGQFGAFTAVAAHDDTVVAVGRVRVDAAAAATVGLAANRGPSGALEPFAPLLDTHAMEFVDAIAGETGLVAVGTRAAERPAMIVEAVPWPATP